MKLLSWLKNNEYKLFFLASLILGLTPLLWYKGLPLAGEEFYALDYAKWWEIFSQGWSSRVNFGEYSVLEPFRFQGLLFQLLKNLGLSVVAAQILWHVILWTITSVFTYLFLYRLFDKKINAFTIFIGTLFYVYSPFFLNISVLLSPPRLVFAVIPIIFTFLLDIHRNQNKIYKNILIINIILLLFSPIFVNLPAGAVLIILVELFFIFEYFFLRKNIQKLLQSSLFFGFLFLLFNIWWIFPVVYKSISAASSIKTETGKFVTIDASDTYDVVSLFGSWAYREQISGTEYYYFPHNLAFDSFPLIFIRYFPFLIIIGAVYLLATSEDDFKNDGFIYFAVLINVVFLILSKGTSEPFGFIYNLLFSKLPYFWIFREPYAKFVPVAAITYVVLIVLGIHLLNKSFERKFGHIRYLVYFVNLIAVGCIALPFLNRSIIWDINDGPVRSYRIDVPDEWHRLSSEWSPDKGYYFLFPSQGFADKYIWESGYSGNPMLLLTEANLLNPSSGYSDRQDIKEVTEYLTLNLINEPEKFLDQAARYNVSGVIFQKDTAYKNTEQWIDRGLDQYSQFKTFANNNVEIAEFNTGDFGTPSLFSIIPDDNIIAISEEDFPVYPVLLNTFDSNYYFQVRNTGLNVTGLIQPSVDIQNNQVIYNLGNFIQKEGVIFLLGDYPEVKDIYLDKQLVSVSDYRKGVKLVSNSGTENCCKSLTYKPVNVVVEKHSQKVQEVLKTKNSDTNILNAEVLYENGFPPEVGKVFFTKLEDFDPAYFNIIELDTENSSDLPLGISLVIVDPGFGNTTYISGYVVQNISEKVMLNFDPYKTNFLKSSGAVDYYLSFYTLRVSEKEQESLYNSKNKVVIDNIGISKIKAPYAFYMNGGEKFLSVKEDIKDVEYQKINDSIYLVTIPGAISTDNRSLLFKNSYDKDWRIYSFSGDNFGLLSLFNLIIKNRGSGVPGNIEFYANRFDLPEDAGNSYVVLFWPHIVTEILFLFSSLSLLLTVSVFIVWRRRLPS